MLALTIAFYFFAVISIWLGIQSVRGGVAFLRYVRKQSSAELVDYTPLATVIAPFRGTAQGLKENIEALLNQNYPVYEIIFVTDQEDDPALSIIESVRAASSGRVPSRIVFAGAAVESGQKVHNLQVATAAVDSTTQVIAFTDVDARPHREWLRALVAPLSDKRVGAATGYRWFVPVHGGLASRLCSVWNASIASALGEEGAKNFCWGGATAIRRETFENLRVRDAWQGSVSDDFGLTRVLHNAELPIHFVPLCLTASFEDPSWSQLFEFTTRQLKITRVYANPLWRAVFLGSTIFVLAFFGGIVLTTIRLLLGLSTLVPIVLLAIMFLLGAAKAAIRLHAVGMLLRDRLDGGTCLSHLLLWPFGSALFLWNAIAAWTSRKIIWRGITYELKSPHEAVIIARNRH